MPGPREGPREKSFDRPSSALTSLSIFMIGRSDSLVGERCDKRGPPPRSEEGYEAGGARSITLSSSSQLSMHSYCPSSSLSVCDKGAVIDVGELGAVRAAMKLLSHHGVVSPSSWKSSLHASGQPRSSFTPALALLLCRRFWNQTVTVFSGTPMLDASCCLTAWEGLDVIVKHNFSAITAS